MRVGLACMVIIALGAAGSNAAQAPSQSSSELEIARAEWQAASRETRRLEAASARAANEASKLAIERQAAASAIAEAEARISAASAELALRRKAVAVARGRLAERQRPIAALVAGLVSLERRPPLLTLAGDGSIDELVRTRALLGALLPYVRQRSRSLSAELANARRLEAETQVVAESVREARAELDRRQRRFAALEQKALDRSSELGRAAVEAGDEAILAEVGVNRLGRLQSAQARSRQTAALLAALPPAPMRPVAGEGQAGRAALPYALPASAPVEDGFGAISAVGIRSRGTRIGTRSGARLAMPADGTIVFSGPYRRYDGVVIIDHGGGWMTMLLNARAEPARGTKLESGEPLGIALGELTVELSHQGNFTSPAVMAARSRSLSIQAQAR